MFTRVLKDALNFLAAALAVLDDDRRVSFLRQALVECHPQFVGVHIIHIIDDDQVLPAKLFQNTAEDTSQTTLAIGKPGQGGVLRLVFELPSVSQTCR